MLTKDIKINQPKACLKVAISGYYEQVQKKWSASFSIQCPNHWNMLIISIAAKL